MSHVTVKNASEDFVRAFIEPGLLASPQYHIDRTQADIKLDQNESPWDWPEPLKEKILRAVQKDAWNRYPAPMAEEMHAGLARYVGVAPECLVTGPGSNYLITLILETFAKHCRGKVVIARPSFALFESHAKAIGVRYESWNLTNDYQYDTTRLPDLTPHSLVMFASPNNPTGNVLPYDVLDRLLSAHPDVLFVGDEAYAEFSETPYTSLLARHANLILLRTFSKTVGAAGVRLGYLVGPSLLVAQVQKLRVPYLLNHFAVEAVSAILNDPGMLPYMQSIINNAKTERLRVYQGLQDIAKTVGFEVFPSEANFLLMRWSNEAGRQAVYEHLLRKKILIRDVSRGPGLAGAMRVTISLPKENDAFLRAMQEYRAGK